MMMRTVGIICEYNPFHNGHLHLLKEARKHHDGQYVICVLSSDFLQRGEPSIINKFERARSAILNGADLVFELPVLYSCRNASEYAYYGVSLLDKVGICDTLMFGSESGDRQVLSDIADVLVNEPSEYRSLLKENLSEGLSYPKSRSNSLMKHFNDTMYSDVIRSSNNILAIEYISAIRNMTSPIQFETIKRVGSAYLDENLTQSYSSATAIRNSIFKEGLSSVKDQIPQVTYQLLDHVFQSYEPVSSSHLDHIINFRLASLTASDLLSYQNVTEGIENRIIDAFGRHMKFEEMVEYISSKRYPKTRIRRMLIHILLDLKKDYLKNEISYARILYASEKGKDLFDVINKNSTIPVFTSYKKFHDIAPTSIRKLLDFEVKASNIYESLRKGPINSDYSHKFEIL